MHIFLCMSDLAISLAFISACRQKKRHIIMRHVKFAGIHQNFMNAIVYTVCQLFDDYIIMLLIILNLH